MAYRSLTWQGATNGTLQLLDQTRLPGELLYRDCETIDQVWQAIKQLCVRGAPAIGVTAAYGVLLGVRTQAQPTLEHVKKATDYLRTSRPTAVNLFWALDRMDATADRYFAQQPGSPLLDHLLAEAEHRLALLRERR
ncbi:MAG TPA: hypothetical protein PLX97_13090, partial [Gemmatales bacterium]|nr:hypothetical protein [Gemmatales bacterium]